MKKLVFIFTIALAFAACQNAEPKTNAPENNASPNTTEVTPPQADPEQIKKAGDEARASLAAVKELTAQIDALPASVKKAKATEIEELRNMAEAITEKQTMMMSGLENATKPQPDAGGSASVAVGPNDPGVVKEYVESIARYKEEVDKMQEQFKAISGNKQ